MRAVIFLSGLFLLVWLTLWALGTYGVVGAGLAFVFGCIGIGSLQGGLLRLIDGDD